MTKTFNKLIYLELSFYNTLDNSVKKIHLKFIKEKWVSVLKILQKYLPQQFVG
jgi:hypothetical protein